MTSDLRERVARLVCAWDGGKICSAMCVTCCNTADAAISLIRNKTLEEAARVVETHSNTRGNSLRNYAAVISTAIRALKDKT